LARRDRLYRYLRISTFAALIVFGAVIAGGVMALVPSLVERVSLVRSEVTVAPSLTCASAVEASRDESCLPGHDVLPVAEAEPAPAPLAKAEAHSEIDSAPEPGLPKQAAAAPAPPVEAPVMTAPARETRPEPAHAEAPVQAEKRVRAQPTPETKTRLTSAPKKAVRRERTAERRTQKALSAMRRFEDPRRDNPTSAYASDGTPRGIVIRPTSIQDMYYYGLR
jgi:outer membrane biosynthesis protein TonB